MERYERIKKIGEGSFGKALLVRRKNDGRHCVMKEVNISRMSAKEREESKKEVKVLSQLKHPNIVSYQESFEGMGNLYIVMDYCEGGDLYQKLVTQKGVNFAEGQVLDYFVQICLALKHIHDRKILHRDLKSQNIFLTKHGIVKLGDFGIARVLKSTVELARTCIGTPYYLSPEICENRPYNNKSDIWSLGCVLYELCTLKHAFEAGNMKNLVLKIIRGNYPPVPNRYSAELRALVAHCFKRSPMERPSVNKILRKPIIQARVKKFLTPEAIEDEFSHTVLHKEKFGAPRQPVARPVSAGVKRPQSAVAQVYGVSVARKPNAGVAAANFRKPQGAVVPSKRPVSAGRKPGPVAQQQKVIEDRRKELEARERRRKNLVENQEQAYQEYLKNIHKQRYEKQQAQRMNRAREAGWKNLLQLDDDKDKKKPEAVAAKQDKVLVKQPKPMEKYAQKDKNTEENQRVEDIPEQRPISVQERRREFVPEQRQIPPQERPFDAWVAAKQAREHGVKGAEAAERARLIEEFRQRKREAAENKARGNYEYQPYSYQQDRQQPVQNDIRGNPVDQKPPRPPIAPVGISARNKEERNYLEQLERIRKQNYQERKNLQNKKPVMYEPSNPVSNRADEAPSYGVNDPRYDPAARRQKIAALKAQADERAAALREELNKRRRNLQQRLENERKEREKEKQFKVENNADRPLTALQNIDKVKAKVVVPAVGLETAMNQVAAARLFRSCSEGDLQQMVKKGQEMIHDRKHWNEEVPLGLADLPLEVTASAMEATSINDAVYKPSPVKEVNESAIARKNWGKEGKTLLISALENKTLANQTCFPPQSPVKADVGATISLPKKQEPKEQSPIGKTIILPKKSSPNIGETITIKAEEKVGGLSPASADNEGGMDKEQGKGDDDKEGSLSSVESLEEKINNKTSDSGEAALEKPGQGMEVEKSTQNEMKTAEGVVDNNNDDDSDIEELTVISPEVLAKQQKPKARSAWAANANQNFNFKESTAKTGEYNTSKENDETKIGMSLSPKKSEINQQGDKEKQDDLFKKTGKNKAAEEKDDLNVEDVSIDNDSFHTPNASLLETRKKGLNTGLYDSPAKVLRTTSLPELHKLSRDENEIDKDSESLEEINSVDDEDDDDNDDDIENETETKDDGENEADEDDEDVDVSDEDKSDEEIEDYEQMLDSLRGVLSSADASPPSSAKVTRSNSNQFELEDNNSSRCSSSASKSIEEEWDSDDDDDDDNNEEEASGAALATKNTAKALTRTEKKLKARETLFQRIEQSRKTLEDELGTDRFLKVYRYIQAMQENEDDEIDVDPTKDPEIREILDGENEHLYQRILYLVLADAAYFEDNE